MLGPPTTPSPPVTKRIVDRTRFLLAPRSLTSRRLKMSSSDGYETLPTSFLGLATELRCRIYEFVLGFESTPTSTAYHLRLTGNNNGARSKSRHVLSTLPLICRVTYLEFSRTRPAICDITFIFQDFTLDDMATWLKQMGSVRLSQVQKWKFEGRARCLDLREPSFPVVTPCGLSSEEPCPTNCVYHVLATERR